MTAGTVKCSPPKCSMPACNASSRCWPSIARRMPSRSGTFSMPSEGSPGDRLELQRLVAGNDDGARNRRQVPRLTALFVVSDELVDLLADDLALVGLLARGDAALEQIPSDLGLARVAPHARRAALLAVAQHLEAHELVDVLGRERSLIELHAKLLHPERGDANHRQAGALSCPGHASAERRVVRDSMCHGRPISSRLRRRRRSPK